ncbi:MAG: copper chaperone PCu(A)C [Acidimicrobiales bacterium]
MSTSRSLSMLVSGVLMLGLIGTACGSDDAGGVVAGDAWARTSPMSAEAGAAYMVLSSDEAVSIVSASAPADVAGTVELHETVAVDPDGNMEEGESMDDEESMEGGDDQAMGDVPMTMRQVPSIDIPAGGEVVLEPGGLHLMLLDLPDPLEEGETFDLTLTTDAGDEITVPVEVRSEAP